MSTSTRAVRANPLSPLDRKALRAAFWGAPWAIKRLRGFDAEQRAYAARILQVAYRAFLAGAGLEPEPEDK